MIHKSFDEMTGKGEASTDTFRLHEDKFWLMPTSYLDFTPSVVVTEQGEKVGWFVFTAYYSDWMFQHDEDMYALVDGKRLQVKGISTYSDTREDRDEIMCIEIMQMQVELEWMGTVAKCESAKIRVLGLDFELTADMRSQIGLLVEAMS